MRAHPISYTPLVCYGLLLAFAAYAAAVVGHWPFYAHPDPKNLPAGYLALVMSWVAILGLGSIVIVPLVYSVSRLVSAAKNQPVQLSKQSAVLFSVGATLWVLDFVQIHVGRYSLLSWIFD